MIAIIITIVCGLVLGYAAWQYFLVPGLSKNKKTDKDLTPVIIILAAGFIVRIICALAYKGHATDMACFTSWADSVFRNGVGNFYQSAGFTDYPPGYMYILYVVGAVKNLFSIDGSAYNLLVKLPAIAADIISGLLIYKTASRKLSSGVAAMISALYVFNPAVITDSSLWGQVDSVYTLFIALTVWLIAEGHLEISYFIFALCILIKPQAFIYTPLIIYGITEKYLYPERRIKELLRSLVIGVCAIAMMILITLPFNISEVFKQYTTALSEYPYFTINALNFWGLFGLNWDQLTLAGTVAGYIFLALIVAFSAAVFFKSKNHSRYYYTAALLAFLTFMLSTKMHERYGFPVMIFLLLALIEARNVHSFALYTAVSLSQFYNIAWVLFVYETDPSKYAFGSSVNIASAAAVLVLAYFIYVTVRIYINNGVNAVSVTPESAARPVGKPAVKTNKKPAAKTAAAKDHPKKRFQRTAALEKITKKDAVIMLIIMAVYAVPAFYDLGDMKAPETGAKMSRSAVTMDFGENKDISLIRMYMGNSPVSAENPLIVSFRESDTNAVEKPVVLTSAAQSQWVEAANASGRARYVTVYTAGNEGVEIKEINVLSPSGMLTPSNVSTEGVNHLFDEVASSAPSNGVTLQAASTASFGKDTDISGLKFFLGAKELNDSDRILTISFLNSRNEVALIKNIKGGSVFCWSNEDISVRADRIVFSTAAEELYLNEVGIKDSAGNAVEPEAFYGNDADKLFDEQDTVPERSTFRNGTYFDEIYHARTAYEFIHHMPVYEWTHPPLGKIIISLGIMLFGMNPFGWRVAGTVIGVLMIPVIYIFARKLMRERWLAVITCLLFTFDFMHFAQTRIATIDVYVTFFIMLMYLFMFKYCTMSFYDTPIRKTLVPLAFSGISMGLGIASKWTGIYAGAGLAIVFFYTFFRRYSEYRYALKTPSGETDGIKHKDVINSYGRNALITVGWCVIFFIIVPALIYGLSYIPYMLVPNSDGIKTIFSNQSAMLTYHGSTVLGSTHPYSSRWYEWIIMKRPIWYYSGTITNEVKEGISAFGNPAVWWMGIPAFFWLAYNIYDKKDRRCAFLILAYLAQLVPWVGVERLTFIYHYFPCVPFIALMIGYSIKLLYDDAKSKKAVRIGAFIYTGAAIVLFAMFYPVLAGHACTLSYADHFLKWFNSWVLL